MRTYKITLKCNDINNPNKVDHYIEHVTYVDEDMFNKIYSLIVKNHYE